MAADLWRATDDELDAALGELRAVEATAAASRQSCLVPVNRCTWGRATRTVSGPMRRALVLRDRAACSRTAPPRLFRCDGHHILHWADGGPTDLANLTSRQYTLCVGLA